MDVKFTDNSDKVLQAFSSAVGVALNLIGAQATEYTRENTPVRTGTLRKTFDWKVHENENCVVIGDRTDRYPDKPYGRYVELGSIHNPHPAHMLQKAATQHTSEYKSIAENALKNA